MDGSSDLRFERALTQDGAVDDDDPVVVLRTPADMDRLLSLSRWPRGVPRIALHVDAIDEDEVEVLETILNMHASNCGCTVGSVAASLSAVAYVAYLLVAVGWPSDWRPGHLLQGIVVLVIAGAVGKIAGVVRARFQLAGELDRLRQRLHSPAAHSGEGS
jgi:hypothetical protein